MKKIHFDNLGKSKLWVFVILLSAFLIFIEYLPLPFEFEDGKTYKLLRASGFLLQALFWSKLFWFRNTVQWNKRGAVIRIKSFFGKSFRFDQIKATELNDKTMTITKENGTELTFDLNEFEESDTQKLNDIMIKNTVVN